MNQLFRAYILSLSLIRIPRLFISLLVWPLVIGLFIAIFQVVISAKYIQIVKSDSKQLTATFSDDREERLLRYLIYGAKEKLPDIKTCIWQDDKLGESAPENCALDSKDLVVRADKNDHELINKYSELYDGSVKTLHICNSCKSSLIIDSISSPANTHASGLVGLGILLLSQITQGRAIVPIYATAKDQIIEIKQAQGTILLTPSPLQNEINVTDASSSMVLVVNVAFLVVITLWLALRAHRKVLDYFIRNDALLPMVAACGKNTFYMALWMITVTRVAFFLIATVPVTIATYILSVPKEVLVNFVGDKLSFFIWLFSLIASLTSVAIVASISELKHRHSWVSFAYKYIPMALCVIGTAVWFICVFVDSKLFDLFKDMIAAVPILGLSPMILAPIFGINPNLLLLHALLSCALSLVMLKLNSRWFAAHLEDL